VALLWAPARRDDAALGAASDLLASLGGFPQLAVAGHAELERLPGVGRARAARVVAALELGRRAVADRPAGRWSIRSPRDLADGLVPELGGLEREELRVVLLNTRNSVLDIVTVYRGSIATALVRIGELFRDAVRVHAAGLVIVHNHPSGDPTPSPDDLHLTAEAVAAGRLLDVAVLDHLIIGRDAWVSLRDRGVPFDRASARA
jgi:DNA repair protein RadC